MKSLSNFVTRDQLAIHLNIEPKTVLEWEKEEGLPVIKIRRSSFYDTEEVAAWLAKRGRQPRG